MNKCKDIKNPIPIECAEKWTAKWQKENKGIHCSAFLIPVPDLINTLKEMGIIDDYGNVVSTEDPDPKIRAYMAIDEAKAKEPGFGEKLVIVGTEVRKFRNGEYITNEHGEIIHFDIVEGETNSFDAVASLASPSGSGAFDFTLPCPNNCDPDSPLNH